MQMQIPPNKPKQQDQKLATSPQSRSGAPESGSDVFPPDTKKDNHDVQPSKERNEAIKSIPVVGAFLVYIITKWGWAGLLLFLSGALCFFFLQYFNLSPQKINDLLDKHRVVSGTNLVLLSKDVNWGDLISRSQSKIQASGYYLNGLDANSICKALDNNKTLTVDMVLTDPEGTAICLRQRDEGNPRTYGRIISKIIELHDNCGEDAWKRLRLKVVDVYPTMSVIIIDDDLYAYFYSQDPSKGANTYGSRSPVLKVPNYVVEPLAEHFTLYLNNTLRAGKQIAANDLAHFKTLSDKRNCTSVLIPQ